ncbi:hypothetical protein COB18_01405 [Candidatus Kaiserbacteria bacterium]|nr:MAG: hypothetical protein COB80_02540 [Candidatus Kaiserbacteria bacterium]PCI90385.1 MAG: hypothetical protein COB18_01405 [Candidatus Kaiserbacteria bacterium]
MEKFVNKKFEANDNLTGMSSDPVLNAILEPINSAFRGIKDSEQTTISSKIFEEARTKAVEEATLYYDKMKQVGRESAEEIAKDVRSFAAERFAELVRAKMPEGTKDNVDIREIRDILLNDKN